MKFGEVRVDEAEGLILAHSLRLPQAMLKKGRVLGAADIRALKLAGINFVTGARLEDGDVGEDEAARMLAQALAGEAVTIGPAFSGRCNLFSSGRGLVAIDRERLDRLNLVDEAVAVATALPYSAVTPRQMVATIKIIPFGVDRRVVEACIAFASSGGPLVSVRPFRPRTAALILSTLPGSKESVLASAAAVTRARVEALGGSVVQELRCPHDIGSLERAFARVLAGGSDMILVIGASATVDRRDVVPAAIQRAGGVIDHFGMPVDPGNLLLLGHIGQTAVVNLPGCGRSPKPNGLDWVLGRLAADVPIRAQDIMRMGAGGLLKEPTRPPAIEQHPSAPAEPRVAALVLADAETEALLEEVAGKPRVTRAVESSLAAGLAPVVVVTGDEADMVEEALPACDVRLIRVRDGEDGLAVGLAALAEDTDAAVILPAGLDPVTPEVLGQMVRAFEPDEARSVVVTVQRGRRGGPMLVGREYFTALAQASDLDGLLADHAEVVFELVIG
ncbi:MAG: NTP transferase domain-containing protein [Pseudomonadota bacterium]